jgi:hypothetical protein
VVGVVGASVAGVVKAAAVCVAASLRAACVAVTSTPGAWGMQAVIRNRDRQTSNAFRNIKTLLSIKTNFFKTRFPVLSL